MNDFVKEIASAMKESKTKAYDTVAKVLRVDEKTAYVHIDGGADETPAQMTINCKAGDSVKIRVSGGKAWLTGNLTSPSTDDTAANEANKTVTKVKKNYENFKYATEENFNSQEGKILEAAKVATNFMKYIDGLGLIVGDMRGNTLGQNTLLDSNGMAVRKGNDEIVRFGIERIYINPEHISGPTYDGDGSVMSSDKNIVISTAQTRDASNPNVGARSALQMYYNRPFDSASIALEVKKGTSGDASNKNVGTGLYMTSGSIYSNVSLAGDVVNMLCPGYSGIGVGKQNVSCSSDNVSCDFGVNNILWDAKNVGYYMLAHHKFTLNQPISKQLTGAVFVWSHYDTSKNSVDNWWWTSFFVPKQHVAWRPGDGMLMSNPYFGLNKYIYIADTFIQGVDTNASNTTQNGIAVKNTEFVLRYVLGV